MYTAEQQALDSTVLTSPDAFLKIPLQPLVDSRTSQKGTALSCKLRMLRSKGGECFSLVCVRISSSPFLLSLLLQKELGWLGS